MNIWVLRWGVVVVMAVATGGLWLSPLAAGRVTPTSPYLTVSFLDIGQSDAIFVETSDGIQLLIDGGPDEISNYMQQIRRDAPFDVVDAN